MIKKKVLGRGIGALISDVSASDAVPLPTGSDNLKVVPIEDITPSIVQPRKRFLEDKLQELAASIKEKGIIEPLVVRRSAGNLEIIAGERRWRAAKLAGLKAVPVIIKTANDAECLELAIIENIQREDLNAIEEAEAYRHLMSFGLSQDDVARKVGKDRATVANYLRLLKLPAEIKEELLNGTISMGHARAILAIEGHAAQVEALRNIIKNGLSVRQTETLEGGSSKKSNKKIVANRPDAARLEDELRAIFGAKINIKDNKGKGKIEIVFFSADDRERILDILRAAGK